MFISSLLSDESQNCRYEANIPCSFKEHGVSDGNQRRISAVNAETVYARYNASYAAIIPCSFKEHGVSDGKQRRISAVNAETVYAQYNARYAAIIP